MQPKLPGPAHDGSGSLSDVDPVPAIDRLGNDIAALRKSIADLLRHVGTKQICSGPNCRGEIFFVFHQDTKKLTPYNGDGTPHFPTCPDRELFHRKREKR